MESEKSEDRDDKNEGETRTSQAVHLGAESYVFCLEFEEGDRGSRGRKTRGRGGGSERVKKEAVCCFTHWC